MELIEQLARAGWKVSVRHDGHEFAVTIFRASRCPLAEDEVHTYKGAGLMELVAIAHGGSPGGTYE